MSTKVSLCITCRGRLHHLRETFPRNLKENEGYKDLEFVILDYDSQDGMEAWARKELAGLTKSGRVVYGKITGVPRFHHAHAKNVAHLLASGDLVVNLDADNFTGKEYAAEMARIFEEAGQRTLICVPDTLHKSPSLYGRIGMGNTLFKELRGYDESIMGWAVEDTDLCHRAIGRQAALRHVEVPGIGAIEHPMAERGKDGGYDPVANQNRVREFLRHKRRTDPKGLGVNLKGWGRATVVVNFGEKTVQAGQGPGRIPEWKIGLLGFRVS